MTEPLEKQRALAFEILKLFPPSVRDDVVECKGFRQRYSISFDAQITFKAGPSFSTSLLFPAVRSLFRKPSEPISIESADGKVWTLSFALEDKATIRLVDGSEQFEIPSFWMLADQADIRMSCFDSDLAKRNLPLETLEPWRQRIAERPLEESEIDEFLTVLASSPQEMAGVIQAELRKHEGKVSALVPRAPGYYRGLTGDRGEAVTVDEYVAGNAQSQISRLLKWDFGKGLAQCLLFCANPRLSALINISGVPANEVEAFFKWLAEEGDRFSQVAGVEVGLRSLPEFPALSPLLVKIIEDIRADDASDTSRLALTSNLFVFVDGEFARTRAFASSPPFWRRLTATAQASMIERGLLSMGGANWDFGGWAAIRAEHFYMQSLADLREEPRWLPDFVSPKQLRLEMLMRARMAGLEAKDFLPEGPLRNLLLGDAADQIPSLTSTPLAHAAGPLEGGSEASIRFPDDLLKHLRDHQDGRVVEANLFASVVNHAQVFKFDKEVSGLIASLLRRVNYRVAFEESSDISFTLTMGLASVAASARDTELADELRILTRVLARRGELDGDAESQMRIALLACASRKEKSEWCKATGEWLFEIAGGNLGRDEAARFRSHVRRLCHAVPELWPHASKVDASLAAISD